MALFYWKTFGGCEDFLLEFKRQFIDPQVLKARYLLAHFISLVSQLSPATLRPPSSVFRPLNAFQLSVFQFFSSR